MRINDIIVEDLRYCTDNRIPDDIAKMHRFLKYLKLEIGNQSFDLEIKTITDNEVVVEPTIILKDANIKYNIFWTKKIRKAKKDGVI